MVTLKFGKANSVVGFSTLKTSRFSFSPRMRSTALWASVAERMIMGLSALIASRQWRM